MEAFDWSHKSLNPEIHRPDHCPKCGVDMTLFGWVTTPNRIITCLKCGISFEEGFVEEED